MWATLILQLIGRAKWILLALALVLVVVFSFMTLKSNIHQAGLEEGLRICAERQLQMVAESEAKRAKLMEEKDREIQSINRRHKSQLDGLRKRPTRTDMSNSPAATPDIPRERGTGLELSREDAEFLAGEAAHAEILRRALMACHPDYKLKELQRNSNESPTP